VASPKPPMTRDKAIKLLRLPDPFTVFQLDEAVKTRLENIHPDFQENVQTAHGMLAEELQKAAAVPNPPPPPYIAPLPPSPPPVFILDEVKRFLIQNIGVLFVLVLFGLGAIYFISQKTILLPEPPQVVKKEIAKPKPPLSPLKKVYTPPPPPSRNYDTNWKIVEKIVSNPTRSEKYLTVKTPLPKFFNKQEFLEERKLIDPRKQCNAIDFSEEGSKKEALRYPTLEVIKYPTYYYENRNGKPIGSFKLNNEVCIKIGHRKFWEVYFSSNTKPAPPPITKEELSSRKPPPYVVEVNGWNIKQKYVERYPYDINRVTYTLVVKDFIWWWFDNEKFLHDQKNLQRKSFCLKENLFVTGDFKEDIGRKRAFYHFEDKDGDSLGSFQLQSRYCPPEIPILTLPD